TAKTTRAPRCATTCSWACPSLLAHPNPPLPRLPSPSPNLFDPLKETALKRRLLLTASMIAATLSLPALAQAPALEVDTIRYQSYSGGQVIFAELADALGYLAPLKLNRLGIVTGGPADIQ